MKNNKDMKKKKTKKKFDPLSDTNEGVDECAIVLDRATCMISSHLLFRFEITHSY